MNTRIRKETHIRNIHNKCWKTRGSCGTDVFWTRNYMLLGCLIQLLQRQFHTTLEDVFVCTVGLGFMVFRLGLGLGLETLWPRPEGFGLGLKIQSHIITELGEVKQL